MNTMSEATIYSNSKVLESKKSTNQSSNLPTLPSNETKQEKFPNEDHATSIQQRKIPSQIISTEDEAFSLSNGSEDPLLVKSQIIQDFKTLFENYSQFTHFMEFLEYFEVEHYAECWSECDKFRTICTSAEINAQIKPSDYETKNSQRIENCDDSSSRNIYDQNVSNGLPDLVSNISKNIVVTPTPSPEDDKSILNQTILSVSSTDQVSFDTQECESHVSPVSTYTESLSQRLYELALEIYSKYIVSESLKSIDVSRSIKDNILENLETRNIFPNLFQSVQEYIYSLMEAEYFSKYLESEFFLKHKVEVFTSEEVCLQDILYCDSAIPYFMEYMEQENALHLLEFWMSISNFKENLLNQLENETYNPEEAQADAMVLYDKYFSLQATQQLGFSDKIRFLLEAAICQDGGPSIQCFDDPAKIVLCVLQRDFLPGYLSSSFHVKFIAELINAVKITSKGRRRTASGSTCLSEESKSSSKGTGRTSFSISHKNTLLAMDSSKQGSRILKNIDDPTLAMRIDSMQILDPDSLWRRKNFTKLSCGYVDELGRFESDLQPEPFLKEESKFSKTLKKIVNIEENKVKEDMAYKVAEMIIKDVTSVTLAPRSSDRLRRTMSIDFHQCPSNGDLSTKPLPRSASHYQYLSSNNLSKDLT